MINLCVYEMRLVSRQRRKAYDMNDVIDFGTATVFCDQKQCRQLCLLYIPRRQICHVRRLVITDEAMGGNLKLKQ